MITYATLSETGGRSINEDSIAAREREGAFFFVLCDGLGGHGAGEVASSLAVGAAVDAFESGQYATAEALLPAAIEKAAEALLEEQRRQNLADDIKTTITLLHLWQNTARWAHVGDSRVYHFGGAKPAGRTLDHSVPQMLVLQGEIKERDIRFHEDRNRLIRVLGMGEEPPRYELSPPLATQPTDSFLLCSDGFWELIDEKEMSRQLKKSGTPEAWLGGMEQAVLKAGRGKNMDNYSAIGVFVR